MPAISAKTIGPMSVRSSVVAVVCLFLLAAFLVQAKGDSQAPAADVSDVIARVNAHSTHIQSGKFLVRTESVLVGDEHENIVRLEEFALDGVRSRMERTTQRPNYPAEDPDRLDSMLILFDGERVIQGVPPDFPTVRTTVPQSPDELQRVLSLPSGLLKTVLRSAVTHVSPLGDTMISAYSADLTCEEHVAGLRCLRFVGQPIQSSNWQIVHSWWIAPERDFAVVQYAEDITWSPTSRVVSRRNVSTVEQWMQSADGFWLPEVTVQRVYLQDRDAEPELARVDTSTILSAAVNISIPDEVFDLNLPETTRVITPSTSQSWRHHTELSSPEN